MRAAAAWAGILMACAGTSTKAPTARAIALPGVGPTGVVVDQLMFDPRTNSVWVPAGVGVVFVVDGTSGAVRTIGGFATQRLSHGASKRIVGPSSAALGEPGTVYIANRGDFSICAIDERTLAKRACGKLDAAPRTIAYLTTIREVWVTTPSDPSIRVLDATTLAEKSRLELTGVPAGLVFDATRGRVYTNLEDKDQTVAIEPMSHQKMATWRTGCGAGGPHGLRFDEPGGILLVACSAKIETLDVAHDGKVLGSLATDDGADDLDYAAATRRVYVAAAKPGTLTVAHLAGNGTLRAIATVRTAEGAGSGVVATDGRVYLAHPAAGELVVVAPP